MFFKCVYGIYGYCSCTWLTVWSLAGLAIFHPLHVRQIEQRFTGNYSYAHETVCMRTRFIYLFAFERIAETKTDLEFFRIECMSAKYHVLLIFPYDFWIN